MCGEKLQMLLVLLAYSGSPPRVRGKAVSGSCMQMVSGITPACAGKSKEPWRICEKQGDHPRVCGEKSGTVFSTFCIAGSPPRVRGKVRSYGSAVLLSGITPACAGKRGRERNAAPGYWDHPRVCGEKLSFPVHGHHHKGSPPRVRGKALVPFLPASRRRITPACAGKSKNVPKK